MRPTRLLPVAVALALLVPAACSTDEEPGAGNDVVSGDDASADPSEFSSPATPTPAPSSEGGDAAPQRPPEVVDTIATGLEVPWGLAFLPDGDAVVTERDSERVLLVAGPQHRVRELGTLDIAQPLGEGGLLGVAVSPDFRQDRLLYFYVSTDTDNRVVKVPLRGDSLGEPETILDGIPRGPNHDGGRLEFGPDGYLYVSTGESGDPPIAQDRDSLGGKILRITTDGDPAPGNPFGTPVYDLGHRNVQGLAFDERGHLWASEFGQDSYDELNLIAKGDNYGWPEVEGEGGEPDYTDPQQVWATDDASPSGLAYLDGHLWMGALKGQRLWRVDVTGDLAVDPKAFFVGEYGRMRTVVVAPDKTLWVTTSNRDGRGEVNEGDDRIIQVRP